MSLALAYVITYGIAGARNLCIRFGRDSYEIVFFQQTSRGRAGGARRCRSRFRHVFEGDLQPDRTAPRWMRASSVKQPLRRCVVQRLERDDVRVLAEQRRRQVLRYLWALLWFSASKRRYIALRECGGHLGDRDCQPLRRGKRAVTDRVGGSDYRIGRRGNGNPLCYIRS